MIGDYIVDCDLFVDGRGYAGRLREINLPKPTKAVEDYTAAGMAGTVDVWLGRLEKLECDFTLVGYDAAALKLWGLAGDAGRSQLTFRGALRRADGTVAALAANITADVKQVDPGTITPGELAPLKFMLGAVVYYKLAIGGETIHEIDIENNKIVIGGTDQNADVRTAIGQ